MGERGLRRFAARGVALIGVVALVAAACALGTSAAMASEACSNEGVRQEARVDPVTGQPYSVGLPECRAYEMVSPPEKQSHDAGIKTALSPLYNPGEVAVAPSGTAAVWTSEVAIQHPLNFGEIPGPEQPYLSHRSESGWSTADTLPPQKEILVPFQGGALGDFSPDLTSDHVTCGFDNVIGSTQGGASKTTLQGVACAKREGAGVGSAGEWEGKGTPLFTPPNFDVIDAASSLGYEASSANLSRVFLVLKPPLLADDFEPSVNGGAQTVGIYEVAPVGPAARLRLVNVGDEGAKPSLLVRRPGPELTEPAWLGNEAPRAEYLHGTQYHAVSESGETVFFVATPEDSEKETGVTPERSRSEQAADAVYARVPCSGEFPNIPCETEAEGHAVEGRQTIKVSDPNEDEGCGACAATTAVGNATTTSKMKVVTVPSGGFRGAVAGMAVTGSGIPSGTTVSEVAGNSLTLSKAATESGSGVMLTFSPVVAGVTLTSGSATVSVTTGGFPGVKAGMAVSGSGIPGGTIVSEVSGNSLALSKAATSGGANVTLAFKTELDEAIFQGASADGSKVFFTTTQKVLLPKGASTATTTNLYEYDFNKKGDEKLTDLTPDPVEAADVLGVVRTSSDGGHVYFMTGAAGLTSEAPIIGQNGNKENIFGEPAKAGVGVENLYGVDTDTGKVKFIAAASGLGVAEGTKAFPHAQMTPDGRDLVFDSTSALAGDTNAGPVNSRTLSQNVEPPGGSNVTLTFSTTVANVTTVSGSTTASVTSGGFPRVAAGLTVSGSGIAGGTTVTAVAGNSLTLSKPAEASSASVTLTFSTAVAGVTTLEGTKEILVTSGGFPGVAAGMSVSGPGINPGVIVEPSANADAVYRYDFKAGEENGELTWISQASPDLKAEREADGATQNPNEGLDSWVAQPSDLIGGYADIDDYDRAVTGEADGAHDGEDIIFTGQERLQKTDVAFGKQAQLYLWHCAAPCPNPGREGVVRMISDGLSGVEPVVSEFVDPTPGLRPTTAISASGGDIFFTTRTALVGQDTDELLDYYDARIGGGYPAPKESQCAGEACQQPPSGSLAPLGQTESSVTPAGGNLPPPTGATLGFTTVKAPETKAQKLAKALKACTRVPKKKRATCNAQAEKKYGSKPKAKAKAKKSKRGAK
jgi:hypothetical protein